MDISIFVETNTPSTDNGTNNNQTNGLATPATPPPANGNGQHSAAQAQGPGLVDQEEQAAANGSYTQTPVPSIPGSELTQNVQPANQYQPDAIVLSAEDYEKRVQAEIDKFYNTNTPTLSSDIQNLSQEETDALLNLDSAYSYLTAGKITHMGGQIDLLEQGEGLWNPSKYTNAYTEALNPDLNLAADDMDLSYFGVAFETSPDLCPAYGDSSDSPYVESKKVLGQNTNFANENTKDFRRKTSNNVEDQIPKSTMQSLMVTFSQGKNNGNLRYDVNSVSVKSFDFNRSDNIMDTRLRRSSLADPLKNMPIQFKSLMLGRSNSVRKNWLDKPTDPFINSTNAGMMQFNYLEIKEVQVRMYSPNVNESRYVTMTKEILDKAKITGGKLYCRVVNYSNSNVAPSINRDLTYRTVESIFTIDAGNGSGSATKNAKSTRDSFESALKSRLSQKPLARRVLESRTSDFPGSY